tara:strand:+ start:12747 stop:13475 length:729 start_codon:yes stop_codon:yes gene_type:complete
MWVLLPLKDFVKAKQRLSGFLSVTERRGLFQAMVEDVLEELVSIAEIDRIILLSDDPVARFLANYYQVECWSERELGQGLNPVLEGAIKRIESSHFNVERVMIVHGDLPLINQAELSAMMVAHGSTMAPSMIIATDACGEGSNIVIMSVTDRVQLQYGSLSLQAHQSLAAAKGLRCQVQRTKFLAKDIDTQDDIIDLIASAPQGCASHTMRFLREQGLVKRLSSMGLIQNMPPVNIQQAASR